MHWIYALLVLLAGLMFVVITPPLQAPDEPTHMIRVIQLARGEVRGVIQDGVLGTDIPVVAHDDLKRFSRMVFQREVGTSVAEVRESIRAAEPWTSEAFTKQAFAPCHFQHYPPPAHVPGVLGVWVTRVFGGNTYHAMYLGRVLNLLMAVGVLWWVFRLLADWPRVQLLVFAVAAAPTSVFLYASVSADPLTITTAMLVFALAVRLRGKWDNRLFVVLVVAAALLSLCKNVYFIVPAIALPAIWCNGEPRKRRLVRIAILGAAATIPLLLWMYYIRDLTSAPALAKTVQPAEQLRMVLQSPLTTLRGWAEYLVNDFRYLRRAVVAMLGWGEILIWGRVLDVYFWVMVAVAAVGLRPAGEGVARERRWWPVDAPLRLAIAIAVAAAIYLALLIMTGRGEVLRTQGRYYLPVIPLVLGAIPIVVYLSGRWFGAWRWTLLAGWAAVMVMAVPAMEERFWSPAQASLRLGEMHRISKIEKAERGGFQRRGNGDMVLRALAPTTYLLTVPRGTRAVEVEFGMFAASWRGQGESDGVEFEVSAVPPQGAAQVLVREFLNPREVEGDRGAQVRRVDLPEGRTVRLVLKTLPGPAGNNAWDWAYWRRVEFLKTAPTGE